MTPLIRLVGVVKASAGPTLRIAGLDLAAGDRVVLSGFDRQSAELLIHLITGAALPEEGEVEIDGRSTRSITTDTEWLASLDRFGLVTERAVLIDSLPVESNLALPLTVSIDPPPDEIRASVRAIAADVGLAADRLALKAGALPAAERIRVHLGRAIAPSPVFLLLEHPTASLAGPAEAAAFGAVLREVSAHRKVGWLALSEDEAFAGAAGARRITVDAVTGRVRQGRVRLIDRLVAHLTGSR